ncbi:hypothetical protein [uncultured Negativibacillus sp.]|uniref:hypothetical protein n=1 Tax=uncultured Negativibacillus sp. TaxID=1980696 RepID=UPI0025ED864E|nr:hypothetical protein [uncultured Negativibacillus sp.]
MNQHNLSKKEWSMITAAVVTASVVAMTAVVCVKYVSVLFKLNKALDIYLKEHKLHHEKNIQKMMEDDYYDDEEISL